MHCFKETWILRQILFYALGMCALFFGTFCEHNVSFYTMSVLYIASIVCMFSIKKQFQSPVYGFCYARYEVCKYAAQELIIDSCGHRFNHPSNYRVVLCTFFDTLCDPSPAFTVHQLLRCLIVTRSSNFSSANIVGAVIVNDPII